MLMIFPLSGMGGIFGINTELRIDPNGSLTLGIKKPGHHSCV